MAVVHHHRRSIIAFGVLGNFVSVLVYFAPAPMFYRIYKAKSTMGYQAVPYVVALFSAMLWMYYAFLKGNAPLLISINSFGCLIETIYISIFLAYATKNAKRKTMMLVILLIGVVYSGIFMVTLFLISGHMRVKVVGWICMGVSICVFASPLSIVFQVVRTKSVEFMPFGLSFFLTLTAVMWFGYGTLLKDLCIALPNVLGFILGLVQMGLYWRYRDPKPNVLGFILGVVQMGLYWIMYRNPKPAVDEKKAAPEHIINVVVLGGPEQVHPVNEITTTPADETGKNIGEDDDGDERRETTPRPTPEILAGDDDESTGGSQIISQVNSVHMEQTVLVVCAAA